MAKTPVNPPTPDLTTDELVARLRTAKAELEALAPAPRVEIDREAVLSMVTVCLRALTQH